jgi:hypothetical protein
MKDRDLSLLELPRLWHAHHQHPQELTTRYAVFALARHQHTGSARR